MLNKIFPENSFQRNLLIKLSSQKVKKRLSSNFIKLNQSKIDELKKSLLQNYFSKHEDGYLFTKYGEYDFNSHMFNRLDINRKTFIPWIDHVKSLQHSKILEIGCGTGCSTVALAEQGASIVAIDIDENALNVARDRCHFYGLSADFKHCNALDIDKYFKHYNFDIIIFYASLEHMFYNERIKALKCAWNLLSQGGLLCVIETPNRLWYYDYHTAKMPFFNWLPDEIAFKYSENSPRDDLNKKFSNINIDSMDEFLRLGRGVSFHEFYLAIGTYEKLNVISYMSKYYRNKSFLKKTKWILSLDGKYERILSKICPSVHKSFFSPDLNLIIRK